MLQNATKNSQKKLAQCGPPFFLLWTKSRKRWQALDALPWMECRTLLVKMQSPGGKRSWHPHEGNSDAHEWILLVENTYTVSKMISTWGIVPFSLPKCENTCIFIKHLRNVIPVWWICQLRKDIREICKSIGSGKHPSSRSGVRVWNLFACVFICVCNGDWRQEPRGIDFVLAEIQK